ncbi:MAG: glycosyltransferase family 2 protein [Chloroflexi bacterium]|nr:glycosyltransferase family 2 protein [Chloroflexota bacterium]
MTHKTQHTRPNAQYIVTGAELGIVIVSWNVRELLRACLTSLLADITLAGVEAVIIVIDSASADGTPAMVQAEFAQVELIACKENVGYVGGNNLGMARLGLAGDDAGFIGAVPPFVWLLNPDTVVRPGASRALLDFMRRHPRCGLCGPKLLNPDGSLQHGAFAFPGLVQLALETYPRLWRFRGTRLDGRYAPAHYEAGVPFRIGHPLGAAMLARTEAVSRVGPLDPGYEMYAEEVDWAMRMKRDGWERWCVPSAEVVHYGGASSGQASERAERTKWRSRQRYYSKYYPALKRWLALQLVPKPYRDASGD